MSAMLLTRVSRMQTKFASNCHETNILMISNEISSKIRTLHFIATVRRKRPMLFVSCLLFCVRFMAE